MGDCRWTCGACRLSGSLRGRTLWSTGVPATATVWLACGWLAVGQAASGKAIRKRYEKGKGGRSYYESGRVAGGPGNGF